MTNVIYLHKHRQTLRIPRAEKYIPDPLIEEHDECEYLMQLINKLCNSEDKEF